jgi:hypothetical protein
MPFIWHYKMSYSLVRKYHILWYENVIFFGKFFLTLQNFLYFLYNESF